MFKEKNDFKQPTAQIQSDVLVISLPNSKEPALWRIDLSTIAESAFSVNSENGQFKLVQNNEADGKNKVLGIYLDKEDAQRALHEILSALLDYQSSTKEERAPVDKVYAFSFSLLKWFAITVIYFGITMFLLVPLGVERYFTQLQLLNQTYATTVQDEPQQAPEETKGPSQLEPGVPVDVDQLFQEN